MESATERDRRIDLDSCTNIQVVARGEGKRACEESQKELSKLITRSPERTGQYQKLKMPQVREELS